MDIDVVFPHITGYVFAFRKTIYPFTIHWQRAFLFWVVTKQSIVLLGARSNEEI